MRKFEKYSENLRHDDNFIYSYDTKVAEIKGDELAELGKWSTTTTKHINYSAKELNLKLVKWHK